MCLVKKPKVVTSTAAENKEVPVLRNPYLDGLPSILRARRGGVQSLTIRRGKTSGTVSTPAPPPTVAPAPTAPSIRGGMSDDQFAEATLYSKMPGLLGIAGKAALQKANL